MVFLDKNLVPGLERRVKLCSLSPFVLVRLSLYFLQEVVDEVVGELSTWPRFLCCPVRCSVSSLNLKFCSPLSKQSGEGGCILLNLSSCFNIVFYNHFSMKAYFVLFYFHLCLRL